MINGWTSRIQMVGAILIVLAGALGMIYLAAHRVDIPVELTVVVAGATGFLWGVANKFPASGDPVRDVVTGIKGGNQIQEKGDQ